MSAAKDYINKKWIDWAVTLIISIIAIFTSFNLELFGNLASKDYVDKEIESVRREQEIQNESIFILLKRIDKRTERLEDRINERFDK